MKIIEVTENKKEYLDLLLLADEQENMVDCYLDNGRMYILDDNGVKSECVITGERNGVLEIKNIATVPEHQGKGYAKPAVQLILQEIRTHYPNANIYLSVYAENHPAIALYRSFGFAFTGELDTKGEEIMIYRNAI